MREKQLELALIQERYKVIQGIEMPALQKELADLSEKVEDVKDR